MSTATSIARDLVPLVLRDSKGRGILCEAAIPQMAVTSSDSDWLRLSFRGACD